MRSLIIAALVVIVVGALLYAFLDAELAQKEKTEKRLRNFAKSSRVHNLELENQKRRKQMSDHLKALEDGQKRRVTLSDRITQAGIKTTTFNYFAFCGAMAIAGFFIGMAMFQSLFFAACCAVIVGAGVPHWGLGHLRSKRLKKFSNDFPDTIDVIVRGVKSGLPLLECIKIIANESEDPIRSEIVTVLSEQNMGMSISDAFDRMSRNVPIQEVRFFSICITLQQKTGGSLADSLSNLSRVLRERKKMKNKIQAFSSEAKSSAMIIGSMPILVGLLLMLIAPDYIGLIFSTSTGVVVMICSGVWMCIGIFVMHQLINFDY
jgi:tight adherence protein B